MNIQDGNIYFIITCLISSIIAGLTIFGKAIMKAFSVNHCDIVVLKASKILETSPFGFINKNIKKNKNNNTEIKKNKKVWKNSWQDLGLYVIISE